MFLNKISNLFKCKKTIVAKHRVYSLYGVSCINDADFIKNTIKEGIKQCGATFLNEQEWYFQPQGYSYCALLSESHASCHLYPEYSFMYCDIFTCGEMDLDKFTDILRKNLKPKKIKTQFIDRSVSNLKP